MTGDVALYAKWTQNNDGYHSVAAYPITIPDTFPHNGLTASSTHAARNAAVTITAASEEGYSLNTLNITSGGKSVAVT